MSFSASDCNDSPDTIPTVPRAFAEATRRSFHGDLFEDPYEWMRQKEDPRTRQYVEQENQYCQERLSHLAGLRRTLLDEFKARVQETDMSVPTRIQGYWYFGRTLEGSQYGLQCRLPVRGDDDWDPPLIDKGSAPGSLPGEEIIFDANKESQGHDFFALGCLDLSRDGRWMLYGLDTSGNERYDLRIRDLSTGKDLPDRIDQVSSGAVLTPDGKWVFYTTVDQAWRPCAVWRHQVGQPRDEDVRVFEEPDQRFWVGLGLSFDEASLMIGSSSKTTSEVLMLSLEDPTGDFVPFIPRQDGVEYDVSLSRLEGAGPDGEDLPVAVVYHNVLNPNFQVDLIDMSRTKPPYHLGQGVCIAQGSPYGCEQGGADAGQSPDTPYRNPANPAILQGARGLGIEGMGIHRSFVVMTYRADSLPRLAVIPKEEAIEDLRAGRPWRFRQVVPGQGLLDHADRGSGQGRVYSIASSDNPSYEAPTMRYIFSSYTVPSELHEMDPATGADRLLKRAEVLGDFDPDRYAERRLWVDVRDGARVPVSLVWRRGMVPALDADGRTGLDDEVIPAPSDPGRLPWPGDEASTSRSLQGGSPMFITGYGAYEISSDPGFSTGRLSLLDRGVLYAVPHVRGGGEMGRAWYEQGRRLQKRHTFEDFIDVTAALQAKGWADPLHTVANGGSAGGLLMGAVANMAPQLYAGIEADVPFVDALTSILDPDLPLTVTEWDEWGDPLHDPEVYRYMKSYSPYENVQNADERIRDHGTGHFPAILITTSMNDTRVLYVEPLKWVARLQEPRVGADALIKVEVEAGHGGISGRYRQWEELAFENAWCLSIMVPDQTPVRDSVSS
ncbi:S9 family peptidase [Bifidobacterium coryneforme]|uniref:S9 family peptidase n=1 Tax=Bifidobacterium coryneforme TaxID=1687 RepID=UPI000529C9CD|nr:S9 family peptidase [Bifidobacterium indicum]